MKKTSTLIVVKEKLFFLWRVIERMRGQLTTLHRRPMYAKDYALVRDAPADHARLAVVLQGPIVRDADFTLETIKFYRIIFPNTPVIVSTWDDEDAEYLDRLRKEGAEVLVNKKPAYRGPSNINFQITSASAGIQRAKDIGVDYVIKNRTDQRVYSPNSREFLLNLVKAFPLTHNYPLQKQRLANLCFATFKYKLYHASDTFIFGAIEDLLLYFDVALVSDQPRDKIFIPEHYLFSEFLKRIGRTLKGTLEDSWATYAEHLVIADQASLDLYWHKPKRHREYPEREYHRNENRLVYFSEWLNLYMDKNNCKEL
ncbi:hypothetical protein HYW17_04000 [Candidatus Uhrbacteria bacterium]|nr:hypothetical protein [Candidatus Uhrbacteria bacterium]